MAAKAKKAGAKDPADIIGAEAVQRRRAAGFAIIPDKAAPPAISSAPVVASADRKLVAALASEIARKGIFSIEYGYWDFFQTMPRQVQVSLIGTLQNAFMSVVEKKTPEELLAWIAASRLERKKTRAAWKIVHATHPGMAPRIEEVLGALDGIHKGRIDPGPENDDPI